MNAPAAATAPPPRGRVLEAVAVAAAAAWVVLAAVFPLLRLWYPFELEWLGGCVADHVARLCDGLPLYTPPTADHVPLLYTPLYMAAGAGAWSVLGEGLPALRVVSMLAALAVQVLLWTSVRAATGSRAAAAVACGVWSGCYFVLDGWYDVERVDSLMLALALAGFVLLQRGKGTASAVLAAAVMVAAYFTKQSALPLAATFATTALLWSPRRGAVFAGAFAAAWLAATRIADASTDGWFSFYTWDLPRGHEYHFEVIGPLLRHDAANVLPTMVLAAWFFVRAWRRLPTREVLARTAAVGGLVASSVLGRCHQGGAVNVLMPAAAALALAAGWSIALAARLGARERAAVLTLCALQGAWFAIDFGNADEPRAPGPRDFGACLPTAADAEAGQRLVQLLRSADGEVLVPHHGFLPRLAGKRGSANAMAVHDVRGPHARGLDEPLHDAFLGAARARRAALVVLDESTLAEMWPMLLPGYAPAGRLVPEGDMRTFVPRAGLPARPVLLFRPER